MLVSYDLRGRRGMRRGLLKVGWDLWFASFQGELIPFNPQDSFVLFRPQSQMRQARLPLPVQQLWLLERADTA